jgi:hypothetical protein
LADVSFKRWTLGICLANFLESFEGSSRILLAGAGES